MESREQSPSEHSTGQGPEEPTLVRHEEEVAGVDTHWRGAGYLHVRKNVETERVREDHPRAVEDVRLRRAAVHEGDSGEVETLPDGSISIPVYEEELVVTKRRVLKERVIVEKRTVTERQRVRAELRKERVSFDADNGVEVEGDLADSRRFAPAPARVGTETRPFFLTSEFIAIAAIAVGLAIAGLTGAITAATAAVLATLGVVAYALARAFAKAQTPGTR